MISREEKFFTSKVGVVIGAVTAASLWGSAFPFMKLAYAILDIQEKDIFEQLVFSSHRFLLASLLIIGYLFLTKGYTPVEKKDLKALFKVGFILTFLQYFFFPIGIAYSTGIQGSIISGTLTFFQVILAHFMLANDSLNWRKVIGLLVGFTGVILVNLSRGDLQLDFGIGELFILMAMFLGALGNVLSKQYAPTMDLVYLCGYQMLFGSLGLLVLGSVKVGVLPFIYSGKALLVLLYLGFLSACGFILWNKVIKYNYVGKVSPYLFFIPVTGVTLSTVLLGEVPHLNSLFALILVIIGILIVNYKQKNKEELSRGGIKTL